METELRARACRLRTAGRVTGAVTTRGFTLPDTVHALA
jgi:hypothetical protein